MSFAYRFLRKKESVYHCFQRNFLNRISNLAYEEIFFSDGIVQNPPVDDENKEVKTAIIIHGLFGSGRNWRTPVKILGESASNNAEVAFRMALVDLRNHGKSAQLDGFHSPHTIQAAAQDILSLIKAKNWQVPIIMGHSLGGKVALECAKASSQVPHSLLKQTWVLDSIPGVAEDQIGDVELVINTLKSLPVHIPSKSWLLNKLKELGFSRRLSEWLATNLRKDDSLPSGQMRWVFNVDSAAEMYESYKQSDYMNFLQNLPTGMEVDFVRAEMSDRWSAGMLSKLEMLSAAGNGKQKVNLHLLHNAGHWLHMDNPKGLSEILVPSFAEILRQKGSI